MKSPIVMATTTMKTVDKRAHGKRLPNSLGCSRAWDRDFLTDSVGAEDWGFPNNSSTRSTSWSNSLCGVPACQSCRSAPFKSLKANGASTVSRNTGTKIPRRFASDASFLTHSEATDIADHRTIAHLDSLSAFSITSSNDLPNGIFRSHQTDQPRALKAPASPLALFRSSDAYLMKISD